MTTDKNADAVNAGATQNNDLNREYYTRQSTERQSKTRLNCYNFGEFMGADFGDGETIAFDVRRGELALIASVTNVGKSTLIRNVVIALATGSEFAPVVPQGIPRRVLLVDFETSASRLREDLANMTRDLPEEMVGLLNANLHVICEGMIREDPLALSQSSHMNELENLGIEKEVDLIVVDTACAAFDLHDENNNAEVANDLIKPLLRLARRLKCSVVLLHHIGKAKSEEGRTKAVHKARGASAFMGYAASVFNLEADTNNPNSVTLTCAKRKSGENYHCTLTLNRESRWFDTPVMANRVPTFYETVVDVVKKTGPAGMSRKAINSALEKKGLSERTVTRLLNEAVSRGELSRPKKGWYSVTEAMNTFNPSRDNSECTESAKYWSLDDERFEFLS